MVLVEQSQPKYSLEMRVRQRESDSDRVVWMKKIAVPSCLVIWGLHQLFCSPDVYFTEMICFQLWSLLVYWTPTSVENRSVGLILSKRGLLACWPLLHDVNKHNNWGTVDRCASKIHPANVVVWIVYEVALEMLYGLDLFSYNNDLVFVFWSFNLGFKILMADSSSDSDNFFRAQIGRWPPLRKASHNRAWNYGAEEVTEKIHTLASTLQVAYEILF